MVHACNPNMQGVLDSKVNLGYKAWPLSRKTKQEEVKENI
jgi:hypothetical protein